jgi:mannose-1-phosphate guanylyltransferase
MALALERSSVVALLAMSATRTWAIVLAAGDGTRLARLTVDDAGRVVPKQYCSLRGGGSLLSQAVDRARHVAPPERILAIVNEHHEPFWRAEFADFERENVIVQPCNRGTAAGVLLPLMEILHRDHEASVVILPSDHYVRAEDVLAQTLDAALLEVESEPRSIVLLGMRPDNPETEYGWIQVLPGASRSRRVAAFVEKPRYEQAHRLFLEGALWNAFVLAARGLTLAALFDELLPELFDAFETAYEGPLSRRRRALESLYARLDVHDFSRDLLQVAPERLRVVEVPACGWTDLGTPQRLAACLSTLPAHEPVRPATALSLTR